MPTSSSRPASVDPCLVREALLSDEFVRRTGKRRQLVASPEAGPEHHHHHHPHRDTLPCSHADGQGADPLAQRRTASQSRSKHRSSPSSPSLGSMMISPRPHGSSGGKGVGTSSPRPSRRPSPILSSEDAVLAASSSGLSTSPGQETSPAAAAPGFASARTRSRFRSERGTPRTVPVARPHRLELNAPDTVSHHAGPSAPLRTASAPVLATRVSSTAPVPSPSHPGTPIPTSTPTPMSRPGPPSALGCAGVLVATPTAPLPPCVTPTEVRASGAEAAPGGRALEAEVVVGDDESTMTVTGRGHLRLELDLALGVAGGLGDARKPAWRRNDEVEDGQQGKEDEDEEAAAARTLPSPRESPPRGLAGVRGSSTLLPLLDVGAASRSRFRRGGDDGAPGTTTTTGAREADLLPSPTSTAPSLADPPRTRRRTSRTPPSPGSGRGQEQLDAQEQQPVEIDAAVGDVSRLPHGRYAPEQEPQQAEEARQLPQQQRPPLATYTSFEESFGIPRPPTPPPSPPPAASTGAGEGTGKSWWPL